MPSNLSPEQIKTLVCANIDAIKTGTLPCTDSEILKMQNDGLITTAYSINPSTKPTPTVKF